LTRLLCQLYSPDSGRITVDGVDLRLPKVYNRLLGRMFEQDKELSSGEWQKVALARALLHDAYIRTYIK
jgi:ABC-type multidrug transport system fused ATPase/permease subunit